MFRRVASIAWCTAVLVVSSGCGQSMKGPAQLGVFDHDAYRAHVQSISSFDSGGTISRTRWSDDSITFRRLGDDYTYEFASGTMWQSEAAESDRPRGRGRRGPGRGRQRDREISPDRRWAAVCRGFNVVLEPGPDGDDAMDPKSVTTDGRRKFRYGMASWVYGEELRQQTAMWWSPDSRSLVYYEFDEREVPDFFLLGDQTELRPTVLREGYPKPGEPNPKVGLHVYDLASGTSRRLACTGSPGEEWYVYRVRFRPDGVELLVHRTNRRQNRLEVVAIDLASGASTVLLTEEQETWQNNAPTMRFLDDGRFIWETERNGVPQYELRDRDGAFVTALSDPDRPVGGIEHVDEATGVMLFTAYGDDHPLNLHLYRVQLDGTGLRCLTPAGWSHTVNVAPNGRWFTSRQETVTRLPITRLYDVDGSEIATLAESDPEVARGYPTPRLFSFPAQDGSTIYGSLYRPPGFDPAQTYPLVIDVYGGPESKAIRNRYRPSHAGCGHGFVVAKIDGRGTAGRGKAFASQVYLKLGSVDLQDQADGVRHLLEHRSYLDPDRVGIFGHSYGGYMAALAILKYPELFRAAVAGAPVTDWRNYDTIYTERYMRTPQENGAGYDEGSCIKHAANLRGHLMLMHGLRDDNVHPTNTWQLVEALRKAGKSADTVLYPNAGHGLGRDAARVRWEYLHEHLADPAQPDDHAPSASDADAA